MIKKLPLVLPVALAVSSAHSLELTATVAPIASLVEQVAGQPVQILIPASESPHYFNMRMSQRALIEQSDLVFWVGESLETPISGALSKLPNAVSLAAKDAELHGEHGHEEHGHEEHGHEEHGHEEHGHEEHGHEEHGHEEHGHEEHGHEEHGHEEHGHEEHGHEEHGHEEHGHEEHGQEEHGHEEHGHEEHGHDEHGHDEHGHDEHGHDEHGHEGHNHDDAHPWMSLEESEHLLTIIASELSRIDSANQAQYEARAQQAIERLHALEAGLKAATAPMKSIPYWVMHDAYGPFEADMGIRRTGVIQANVNVKPTAKELANLRQQVQSGGCIFNEPQMDARWIELVAKESNVSVHTLDPLGTELAAGPELHAQLLKSIAAAFADCADNVTN